MEQKEAKKDEAKKGVLPIVIFTVFIDLIGFSIVLPILAPLLAIPGSSSIMPNTPYDQRLIILGFLIASYALAQFLATPIIGQLSDRYGRKPLLAFSLIGTLVARVVFIYGIVTANIYLLFASRIFDGITGGNISVAQSAIADVSTPQTKAKNFGLMGAAFGLGFIIGPYIGGRLGDAGIVNWFAQFFPTWVASSSTLPLWFATVLCALNILFLFWKFPETLKERIHRKLSAGMAITNTIKAFALPKLRVVFITLFLMTIGFSFFTQFLSVYIQNKFAPEIAQSVEDKISRGDLSIVIPQQIQQIPVPQAKEAAVADYTAKIKGVYQGAESQSKASDFFSYIGFWIVIAQAVVARILASKFKSSVLLRAGLLVMMFSALAFLIPTQYFWIFIIGPFFALSNGLIQPNISAIISNTADAQSQGEVLGGSQSVQALAQAIPPIVSGFVSAVSLSAPILLAAGFTFAAFLVFAIFYKEASHEKLHEE